MKGRDWYQETETAEEYDEWRFSRGGELVDRGEKEALFDLVGDISGRSVLEIACGTGRFTLEFAERGADVVAVDISEPMIRQAVVKAERDGVDVDFLRCDARRLPFPPDCFDVVVAMRFFHLVDSPATYLRELARVSRGRVLFDTFSQRSARVVYNRFLPMGSRLYTDDEVRGFVREAGLELVRSRDDFVFPFGLYRVTPTPLAEGIRGVDDTLRDTAAERFSSVSYWLAEK